MEKEEKEMKVLIERLEEKNKKLDELTRRINGMIIRTQTESKPLCKTCKRHHFGICFLNKFSKDYLNKKSKIIKNQILNEKPQKIEEKETKRKQENGREQIEQEFKELFIKPDKIKYCKVEKCKIDAIKGEKIMKR